MADLLEIAAAVKQRRKELGITQRELAARARVARNRVEALEAERLPEIGFKTLTRIMKAVGLDLRVVNLNQRRPTLEDLLEEKIGE